MLFFVRQLKDSYRSLILKKFDIQGGDYEDNSSSPDNIAEDLEKSDNVPQYLKSVDLKALEDYLKSIDGGRAWNTAWDGNSADGTISEKDLTLDTDNKAVKKLFEALDIESSLNNGIQISEIIKKVEKLSKEVEQNTKATSKKLDDYKEGVRNYLETKENTGENEHLEDIDKKNFKEFRKRVEAYFETNRSLLLSYVSQVDALDSDPQEQEIELTTLNWREEASKDSDVFNALLKHFGYKDSRSLWTKLIGFDWTIESERKSFKAREENKEEVDLNNIESIKNYLFDFDSNGEISTSLKDALSEIAIDDYVKTKKDLENILENLGFDRDLSQIKEKSSLKDDFATRLITLLKMGPVPFTVLVKKYGYKNFMKKKLELEKKAEDDTEEYANQQKNRIVAKLKSLLGKDPKEEQIRVVKDATIAISLGYTKALGANMDMSKLTEGIIDGLNIGVNQNGEVLIGLNKSLLNIQRNLGSLGFDVTSGISLNGLGAHASVSAEKDNSFEDSTIKGSVGAGVGISYGGATYFILDASITNPAIDNVEGINRVMAREEAILDKVISGKILSASDSSVQDLYKTGLNGKKLSKKEIEIARDNFGKLKAKYDALVSSVDVQFKAEVEKKFKKAVLETMLNKMFQQAEGFKVTGIGGFLIPGVVGGIYPITEYNWINYDVKENKTGNEIAREITKMPLRKFLEKKHTDGAIKLSDDGNSIIVDPKKVNINFEGDNYGKQKNEDGTVTISPKDGNILNVYVSQNYEYSDEKDKTYERFDLTVNTVETNTETIGDDFRELRKDLKNIENGFTYRTRYNLETIKGESLLDPNADLQDRWSALQRLVKLGKRYKNKKYPKGKEGIGALGKTNLDKIINSVGDDIDKQKYVLSKVLAYLKKARDFDGKTALQMINTETGDRKNRKKVFDKIWEQEGLGGFSKERETYYKKLKDAYKGNSYEKPKTTTMVGLSFDASASLVGGKSKKGVETLKGDLDMIADNNGQPITVEITDPNKVAKLKEMAREAGVPDVDDLVFHFYKDPYGFDDRILVGRKAPSGVRGQAWSGAQHIDQANNSLGIIPVWTWDDREPEPKKEEPTEEPTTEPTDEPTQPPKPTEKPTTEPTGEPTQPPKPTETPTTAPTDTPTQAPTGAPGDE